MTDLAQVALEFCHECLGWEKSDTFTIGGGAQVVRNLSAVGAGSIFNASDLNAVMEAVRQASTSQGIKIQIEVCPDPIEKLQRWTVRAFVGEAIWEGSSLHRDLPRLLLRACLEAGRKRMEAALD